MTTIIKRELSEEQDSTLASPVRDKISSSRTVSPTANDSAASEDGSIAVDESLVDSKPTLTHQPSNHVDNQLPNTNASNKYQAGSETDPYEVASSVGHSSQNSVESSEKKRKLSDAGTVLVNHESKGKEEQRRLAETQLYQAFLGSSTVSRQLTMAQHTPIISQ
jgi:hypothetical protein